MSDKNSKEVKEATKFTINLINNDVLSYKPGNVTKSPCAKLELKSIISAKIGKDENTNSTYYLLLFKTNPGLAEFEATVKYEKATSKFSITGTISRLNKYAGQSDCANIDWLKKYCYCKHKG